ncbi:MAG: small conductance mechanosensitive channel [Granulosicoccus sp.]|jgi:small conductance mechanosensitive channel
MNEICNNQTDYASTVMNYGQKLLIAILILIIGFWIAGMMVKAVKKVMEKKGFGPALQSFLGSMLSITLKAMIVVSALGTMGIEMTSFVALLGAAGLAVGMALSGTLQSFAGGVMILLFKPFKVGDLIEAQGHVGWVQEIQIFVTIITTPDTRTVIIPNGILSNGDITNNSKLGKMRVDLVIPYESNIKQAR